MWWPLGSPPGFGQLQKLLLVLAGVYSVQHQLYSTGVTVSTGLNLGTLGRIGMALADPTRRQVLVHLMGGPGYPAEMAEEFGTTRANLSNH